MRKLAILSLALSSVLYGATAAAAAQVTVTGDATGSKPISALAAARYEAYQQCAALGGTLDAQTERVSASQMPPYYTVVTVQCVIP